MRNSIPSAYRWPLLAALFLHILLISFLFVSLPASQYRLPGPVAKTKIINASVVDQAAVGKAVEQMEQEREAAEQRRREQAEQMRAEAAALRQQQLQEEQRTAQMKLQQEKLLQQKNQEKVLATQLKNEQIAEQKAAAAQQKAIAEEKQAAAAVQKKADEAQKKAKEAQEKAAALAQQKAIQAKQTAAAKHALALKRQQQALAAESKKLEQQMLQQQLSSDQNKVAAEQAQHINGIVNIYIARIRNKVHDTWTKPQNIDNLSTTFAIQLAPGGVVLNVEMVRSSGNTFFDRSAKVAIYKASPLPVPQDPLVFDKFRNFDFTFHS